jgi:hypothetical protein
VITLEYLSKISSVIREDFISTTLIRRNSVVRPLSRRISFLSESSFLGKRYENLFLYPRDTEDQSLILSPGDYIVQCDSGFIDIPFYAKVYAKEPYHLAVTETSEVFFLFSTDCENPSLYKENLILPFVDSISTPAYLNFPYSSISSRLLSDEHRALWMNRYRTYIDTIDPLKEISYGADFVGAISIKLEFDSLYGWYFSYNFEDDEQTFLLDAESIVGDYRSIDYLSEPSFQTADLSDVDLSVLISFYKDSDNYASLVVLPNYMGAMIGKNSGVEFRYSLCGLENYRDTPIMFFTTDSIAVGFQNQQYLFEFENLFQYETIFIGYDGISNYMNNKISEVYL